ncbi:MAG: YciI family protein [Pseudomonadota bacterium]|nr:YciI family protein [Pseudomonadota bacterium]
MPLFSIVCTDAPNSLEQRLAVRPRHLARLQALHAEGRVILAGPNPLDHDDPAQGFSGSLLVLDFPDLASLETWLADEPYSLEGVYANIEVKPFRQALP